MDRTLQITLALIAVTASAAAQDVTPSPSPQAADTSSIILAPKPEASPLAPNPGLGAGDRPASQGVSAEISSGMPGYRPVLPGSKSGTPAMDVRTVDKPKNQIIRLPVSVMQRYVVREHPLPVFRVRDLYTPAGLVALSFKEHPGLRIGNIFNLNAGLAYEIIMQEQLRDSRDDLVDTAHAMAVGGDTEDGNAVQQAIIDESFEASGGQGGPVGLK